SYLGLAELLEVDKEECLVMTVIDLRHYRTTETKAPIVSPFPAAQQMSASIIGKGLTRVKSFVDKIVVNAAMELVRPRPHRHVKQTTPRLTEFSREVAGLNRNLLNGLYALLRLRNLTVLDRSGGILAIDPQRGGVALHPVDAHRLIR